MSQFIADNDGPVKNLQQELIQHRKELAKIHSKYKKTPPKDKKKRDLLIKKYQDELDATDACRNQLREILNILGADQPRQTIVVQVIEPKNR